MAEYEEPLSDRELDVLSCLAEGNSNREIAQQLSISHNTVKVHLRNIYTKLGVSSRTEATTVALQKGVLTIPGIEVEGDDEEEPAPEPEEQKAPSPAEAPSAAPAEGPDGNGAPPVLAPPDQVAVAGHGGSPAEAGPADVIQASGAPAQHPASRRLLLAVGLVALLALVVAAAAARQAWWGAEATAPVATVVETAPAAPRAEDAEVSLGANWRQGPAFAPARSGAAAASVGLAVYQIGGETAAGVTNAVSVYDTQTRQWQPAQPKITPVADATAAVLGGEIYVVGGRLENGQATAVVEAYSPLNDGWRPVTPLPAAAMGGVLVAGSDALYHFGGQRDGTVLDESYRFDLSLQQWETLAPLQQPRVFAAGGLLSGQPYIVGGSDGQRPLASCEYFDLTAASWSTCPDMQSPRAGAAAAVVLNELYVIGGAPAADALLGEVYAVEGGWSEMEAPPELATSADWSHLGVTNVETRIYALGGLRAGERSDGTFVYAPLVYQFFIPAASAGSGE